MIPYYILVFFALRQIGAASSDDAKNGVAAREPVITSVVLDRLPAAPARSPLPVQRRALHSGSLRITSSKCGAPAALEGDLITSEAHYRCAAPVGAGSRRRRSARGVVLLPGARRRHSLSWRV